MEDEAYAPPQPEDREPEEEPQEKKPRTRSDRWRREAGVFVSIREPNWAATNSTRL